MGAGETSRNHSHARPMSVGRAVSSGLQKPVPAAQTAPRPAVIASNLPLKSGSAPATKLDAIPGPSLDPVNDISRKRSKPAIQKPHRLEAVAAKSPSQQSEDGSATTTGAKKPAPARVSTPEEAPPVARPKKHKTTAKITPPDTSDSGDSGDSASEATTRRIVVPRKVKPRPVDTSADSGDQNDFVPAKPKMKVRDTETASSGLFHVHLGAFHSRDAATHEAERARVKGFATQVVPVTHNGRTLYRVQAGAFRERERAETVKQNLQDASLDASVSEQRR